MTERRVLVCGGRDFDDMVLLQFALENRLLPNDIVVHGAARGADQMAAIYWNAKGGTTEAHPADWNRHGKGAGFHRNEEMVQSGLDLCIAFPGGRGTADMVRRCQSAGVPVFHAYTSKPITGETT